MAFQFVCLRDKNSATEEFFLTFPAITEIANTFPKGKVFESEEIKIAVGKIAKLFENKIEQERISRRTIKPTTRMVKMAKKEIEKIKSGHSYEIIISDELTILNVSADKIDTQSG